jgi:hypothetical protein
MGEFICRICHLVNYLYYYAEDDSCNICKAAGLRKVTFEVESYRDPWTHTEYEYQHTGHCPYCGGNKLMVVKDGDDAIELICVSAGSCTYHAEITSYKEA